MQKRERARYWPSPVPMLPPAGTGRERSGPATAGRSRWWRCSCPGGGSARRRRWRTWGGAWPSGRPPPRIPRTQGDPCLVMWPWRTVRSELRTAGVRPAQAHSLRAVENRAMSPISATNVIAVSLPTPGRTMSAWTRGSGLASPAISRSSRAIGAAKASSSPQQSWMIARGLGGSSKSANQARPGPVHRLEWSGMPRSASTACTRFLHEVDSRTRAARWRSRARRSRTCWGRSRPRAADQPAAAGPGWPHPPCRSCSRAEAIALPRLGWTRCGSSSSSSSNSTSHPQP